MQGSFPVVARDLLRPGWWLSVYPEAGEAGGSFRSARPPRRAVNVRGLPAADPERSRAEAARRARGQVRRYCAANRLNVMWTLTYAGQGCHDPAQFRADVGEFFRDLREALGGAPIPYVWVPEWHPGGHGLHAHVAVHGFIRYALAKRVWGRGIVRYSLPRHLPVGTTALGEARRLGGYLSKYMGKDFDRRSAGGLHRYDVAEGFQPVKVRVYGPTLAAAIDTASQQHMHGLSPAHEWLSDNQPDWQAPPAAWFAWA